MVERLELRQNEPRSIVDGTQILCFVLVCFVIVNVDDIGETSRPLAGPADESKRTKHVQGWLCKIEYVSQWHCFLREPRACRARFVVLFLAYKTLSIDLNHLEPAI